MTLKELIWYWVGLAVLGTGFGIIAIIAASVCPLVLLIVLFDLLWRPSEAQD